MVILFAAYLYQISEFDYDCIVEGDDGVVGSHDPDFLKFIAILSGRLGLEMTYNI